MENWFQIDKDKGDQKDVGKVESGGEIVYLDTGGSCKIGPEMETQLGREEKNY
jgi:hypothetical protein